MPSDSSTTRYCIPTSYEAKVSKGMKSAPKVNSLCLYRNCTVLKYRPILQPQITNQKYKKTNCVKYRTVGSELNTHINVSMASFTIMPYPLWWQHLGRLSVTFWTKQRCSTVPALLRLQTPRAGLPQSNYKNATCQEFTKVGGVQPSLQMRQPISPQLATTQSVVKY